MKIKQKEPNIYLDWVLVTGCWLVPGPAWCVVLNQRYKKVRLIEKFLSMSDNMKKSVVSCMSDREVLLYASKYINDDGFGMFRFDFP